MPKLPDINQKESSSSFGSSKKEPRTRRQPILFSNPEKQKVINHPYFTPTVRFDANDRLVWFKNLHCRSISTSSLYSTKPSLVNPTTLIIDILWIIIYGYF